MAIRHASVLATLATLLAMVLACGSSRSIPTLAPDAAQPGDASTAPDGAGEAPASLGEVEAGAANEGGTAVDATLEASEQDAAADEDSGSDSSMDLGFQIDTGIDGGGMLLCNFAGVTPGLACADGQYCTSFIGGPIGSVASYSCGTFPAACLTDRTCECLCRRTSTGSAGNCSTSGGTGTNCTCIPREGSLTLLCAAP